MDFQSYECPLCNFMSPTRELWLSHLRGVHINDDNFSIVCGINHCDASYSKCSSFLSHVYRRHRGELSAANQPEHPATEIDISSEQPNLEHSRSSNQATESMLPRSIHMEHAISHLLGTDNIFQMKKTALYILNLKEVHGISETAIQHIIDETKSMFYHTVHRIEAGVGEQLSRNGIEVPESFEHMFSDISDPFRGLHTSYLQEKFYREKLNCTDPVEVSIGPTRYVTKFSGSKRTKALVSDTIQYIPVENTLSSLLQSAPDIVSEINNFHGTDGKMMRDICDGSVFREHPLFKKDNKAIQIIGYYDEIELCNPLGSSSKKHKLGCLFFSIGNIHPRFRSQLKCIFVAAVGRNAVIRRHGINLFLKPFIDSMLVLSEKGLTVRLNGESHVFKVGLLAVLADTLAAHSIGGFKENMSFARRICRSCMATTEQIQENFIESNFELRTKEKHTAQLGEIEHDSSKSVEYGINFDSALAQIPHFSVAQNLPHDLMHDLLEGVVPYEMKLLLSYLADAQLVSISTLNDRLSRFDFGYSETSDIPSLIDEKILKSDKKIRQSASKMLLLATYLPLLIGDLVPEDCEQFCLFVILLKICAVTMAWEVSPGTVGYLRILIEEHHVKFRKLYPSASFIPKMHYMVHYPSQILKYGPLIYSWTMRHEAKLQTVKRAARHGNFKNIAYTIAKKSQHLLCYYLNCGQPFLVQTTELPNTLNSISPSEELLSFISDSQLTINTTKRAMWLKYGVFYFKKYSYIYLGNGGLYPLFGKIQDIIVLECNDLSQAYLLLVERCETLYYDSHFNSFAIKPLDVFVYTNIHSLPCHPTLHSHFAFGKPETFLTLKHHVM